MTRSCTVLLAAVLILGCTSLAAGPPPVTHIESYTGEVLIDTKGAYVVVLVDTNKNGRDGLVDRWFVLQAAAPVTPLSTHATTAQIVHSAGYLQVVVPDQRIAYELVLGGDEQKHEVPAGFTTTRIEGFGLSHNTGQTKVRIPKIRRDSATAFDCVGCNDEFNLCVDGCDGSGGGGGAVSCSAGGTGSTSCSVTSGMYTCSATCGQGYYSCCNYTAYAVSCRCYPN